MHAAFTLSIHATYKSQGNQPQSRLTPTPHQTADKNYPIGQEALPSDQQRTVKLAELRAIELNLQKRTDFGVGTA